MPIEPLPSDALRNRTPLDAIPFETTASAGAEPAPPVGQKRALDALRFGAAIPGEGYNVFVMGHAGVGRHSHVRAMLEAQAKEGPPPSDVLYVHDFTRPERPRPLVLPPGRGGALKRELADLVSELRADLPRAFESEEFRRAKKRIEEDYKHKHETQLTKLRDAAQGRRVAVMPTPMGFALAPIRGDTIVSPEEYEKLSDEARARFDAAMEQTKEELRDLLEGLPRLEKQMRAELRALVRSTAVAVVKRHVDDVREGWTDEPTVIAHLAALERDVCEHVEDFTRSEETSEGIEALLERPGLKRYEVNLLVDSSEAKHAPVVYENHPTFANVIGRVEHTQKLGALVTDFSLIKAGALHRANGGYLILDARAALSQPFTWESLKRALRSREIRIESAAQAFGLSTASLEPEPVPLAVKVVLVGEREIFSLLDMLDPDFRTLFRVLVDFDDELDRTGDHVAGYARLIASLANAEKLLPLDRGAVARVLDEAARLAGDTRKLSACVRDTFDLARAASFGARRAGAEVVRAAHVDAAVRDERHRSDRVRSIIEEAVVTGTLAIATEGRRVGQVNGLSVSMAGRTAFGRPTRITATVRLGRGEVVDIEREVELGGPLHSKGVLILSSFLGARYALEMPLSLHASLVFEQSHGLVEGDSASTAELCALLSALAEVPLAQSIALTGAVNQHGEVQAIGGVNEKIEGFFDVCRARGEGGPHGVIIPRTNARHLMLRDDVVEAAAAGKFRIWAVSHVDEVLELLAGMPAGDRGKDGAFPAESFNARVEARLVALAERRIALGREQRSKTGD